MRRTPTIDELIALYETKDLDCEALEYGPNSGFVGMAVFCDGAVGEAELFVEARYGDDDEFDIAVFQLIPGLNDRDPVIQREAEVGLRTVVSIPYPGRGTKAAERELFMALTDGDCVDDNCQLDFVGGHWSFRRFRPGGWLIRLSLDGTSR